MRTLWNQADQKCIFFFLILGKKEVSFPLQNMDSGLLVDEEKPLHVTDHAISLPDVFSESRGISGVSDSPLALSPDPTNHSLTFVTPTSGIFNSPRNPQAKTQPFSTTLPRNKANQTPLGAVRTGDETAAEEKPPCEEKHVTSTPYMGIGSLRGSIGRPFETCSRLGTLRGISSEETFMGESGMVIVAVILKCVFPRTILR